VIEVVINRLPNSKLSPNARVHWRTRHKAGSEDMEEIIPIVWVAKEGVKGLPYKKAHISIEWVASDKRKRDTDNLLSASKYFIDSLRHGGIIQDDDAENVTYSLSYRVSKEEGPRTVIRITPA
jgi:Holliday junction resolvase RusA-like endonuclease